MRFRPQTSYGLHIEGQPWNWAQRQGEHAEASEMLSPTLRKSWTSESKKQSCGIHATVKHRAKSKQLMTADLGGFIY